MLIVTGHVDTGLFAALGDNADRMFQTFRVPMYYFVSGIFFKRYGGFFDFARKKVNNILVTFAFFYLFAYLVQMAVHFLPAGLHVYGDFHWGYIVQPLTQRYWDCNVPLWFLMSLFWVNIMYYVLQMLTDRWWVQVAVVLAMAAGGYALCASHIKPLYYLDTALVGMPFFVLGSLLRGRDVLRPLALDRWGLVAFPVALVMTYFLAGEIDIFSQVLPVVYSHCRPAVVQQEHWFIARSQLSGAILCGGVGHSLCLHSPGAGLGQVLDRVRRAGLVAADPVAGAGPDVSHYRVVY